LWRIFCLRTQPRSASWSAERSVELGVRAASQPALEPAKRVKRPSPLPPDNKKAPTGPKKPFTMSYDGVTEADYITYLVARGTR